MRQDSATAASKASRMATCHVLVGMIDRTGMTDVHILARQAHIDMDVIYFALVMMLVRRLDGHMAADDAVEDALELCRLLPDTGLNGR